MKTPAVAGGAIVFAARSVSRRKERIEDEEAANAASREVKCVLRDENRRNVIVGLCGEGFTVGSVEAAEEIETSPRAFSYRKPGFRSDFPTFYVESEPWPYEEDGPGKPVVLKGYIDHDYAPHSRPYDTLGKLQDCCGKPEGARPPWCPASRGVRQPVWEAEREAEEAEREGKKTGKRRALRRKNRRQS